MYIPVLRYRLAEKNALKSLSAMKIFTVDKIIPLIEIVQHYPTGRIPAEPRRFEHIYTEEFMNYKFPLIVDIPIYLDLDAKKIEEKHRNFLYPNALDIEVRINYLLKLSRLPNIIPVATYNPANCNAPGILSLQAHAFRKAFSYGAICFRLFTGISKGMLTELKSVVNSQDLIILDLREEKFNNKTLLQLYKELIDIKLEKKCLIGLLNSPIPNNFSASGISNDSSIDKFNCSLLDNYKKLGFDFFADFAGIKRDLLIESYRGYITNILYCSKSNSYIGFSAKPSMDPRDFAAVIAPSIIKSVHWQNYEMQHRSFCPGCIEIINKVNNLSHPGNRSTWKSISIKHYIYSMHELLFSNSNL